MKMAPLRNLCWIQERIEYFAEKEQSLTYCEISKCQKNHFSFWFFSFMEHPAFKPRAFSFTLRTFRFPNFIIKGLHVGWHEIFETLRKNSTIVVERMPMMVSSDKDTRLTAIDSFPATTSDWYPFFWKTSKTLCSLTFRTQNDSIEMSFNADSFDEAFKMYEDILDQIVLEHKKSDENRTIIYTSKGDHWAQIGNRPSRSLDTVYMDKQVKTKLVEQIQQFRDSEKLYGQFGRPWKRVILLHGPPGTGKTSLITSLCARFNKSVAKLNISSCDITDFESLNNEDLPHNSWVLLEDIDAAFSKTHSGEDSGVDATRTAKSSIDFSTLINCLDGLSTPHGIVFFLTTNHVMKLDPALLRPGRVDCAIEMSLPNREAKLQMLESIAPQCKQEHEIFLNLFEERFTSLAMLQEHLFNCYVSNTSILKVADK